MTLAVLPAKGGYVAALACSVCVNLYCFRHLVTATAYCQIMVTYSLSPQTLLAMSSQWCPSLGKASLTALVPSAVEIESRLGTLN